MGIFPLLVACLRVEPSVCILQSFFRARYTCMSTAESRIAARVIAWLGPKTGPQPRTQRCAENAQNSSLCTPLGALSVSSVFRVCSFTLGAARTHSMPTESRKPFRDALAAASAPQPRAGQFMLPQGRSSDCAFCAFFCGVVSVSSPPDAGSKDQARCFAVGRICSRTRRAPTGDNCGGFQAGAGAGIRLRHDWAAST